MARERVFGVIDLGTNSIRFEIHRVRGGFICTEHREKRMIRLGEGLFPGRLLRREAVGRALDALRDFRAALDLHRAGKVYAFATSAVREARNRAAFLDRVRRAAGIRLRVLSGKGEATLIARAILRREKRPGSVLLVDIGGGSTEISRCRGRAIVDAQSLPLGVARIAQIHLRGVPPAAEEVEALRAAIRRTLRRRFKDPQPIPRLIGSSGTTKGVAQLLRPGNLFAPFGRKELAALNDRLALLDKRGLLAFPGMEPKRVDLILGGSILLEECAAHFGARTIRFTDCALKEGILDLALAR